MKQSAYRFSLAVLLTLLAPWQGAVAAPDALESRVKVAFLLNFARFASFPAEKFTSPAAPLDICVVLPDSLESTLDTSLQGKRVNGHAVRVRRAERAESLRDCHLVYLSSRSDSELEAQLNALRGSGALTVHEADSAKSAGVMRLMLEDSRLRFEVNLAAAEREKIQLAAGLLDIGKRVRQ